MRKQNMYFIGIVAVVAILGGWYLYDSGFFAGATTGGQFSIGFGNVRVVCELTLANGETVEITDKDSQLKVTKEGEEVVNVNISLVANITSTGYTMLEINIEPNSTALIPSGGETIPTDLEDVNCWHDIHAPGAGPAVPIYVKNFTADYAQQFDTMPTEDIVLFATATDFNEAFEAGDPYGDWEFAWHFQGDACYRAGTGNVGAPEWELWNMTELLLEPLNGTVIINYAPDGTIDFNWNQDIVWS